MRVLEYSETVVWEDPLVVLIEETLQHEPGIVTSTYTVYSGGERLFTAISKEAANMAINDIIRGYEDAEHFRSY